MRRGGIKERYQFYKSTGKLPYKNGRIDEELMYRERMKDVARENYERWGYNSPADAWQDAVNDPTYDYRGYYSDPEFQNVNANSQTHWPDRYKTPFYPTFSSDSKYHGKQSEKNPYGLRGGQWVGDKFIPAAWQNPIRIPHYAGGKDGWTPDQGWTVTRRGGKSYVSLGQPEEPTMKRPYWVTARTKQLDYGDLEKAYTAATAGILPNYLTAARNFVQGDIADGLRRLGYTSETQYTPDGIMYSTVPIIGGPAEPSIARGGNIKRIDRRSDFDFEVVPGGNVSGI